MSRRASRDGKAGAKADPRTGHVPTALPAWKKLVFALSIILTVAGGAGFAYAALTDDTAATTTGGGTADPALARGLMAGTETGQPADAPLEPTALREWSPVMFRLGFSFFVGFCIAYALRSVIKIAVVLIGLVLIAIVALQYGGVIDVDWSGLEGHYDAVVGWLGRQTTSMRDFLTGYLPSSASGLTGLAVGFRRR